MSKIYMCLLLGNMAFDDSNTTRIIARTNTWKGFSVFSSGLTDNSPELLLTYREEKLNECKEEYDLFKTRCIKVDTYIARYRRLVNRTEDERDKTMDNKSKMAKELVQYDVADIRKISDDTSIISGRLIDARLMCKFNVAATFGKQPNKMLQQ